MSTIQRLLEHFQVHGNASGVPEGAFQVGFGDSGQGPEVQELRNEVNQLRSRLATYGVGHGSPEDANPWFTGGDDPWAGFPQAFPGGFGGWAGVPGGLARGGFGEDFQPGPALAVTGEGSGYGGPGNVFGSLGAGLLPGCSGAGALVAAFLNSR